MTGEAAVRSPDAIVTWKTYVLSLHDVCRALNIPADGDEIEADLPDRGQLRVIVKAVS